MQDETYDCHVLIGVVWDLGSVRGSTSGGVDGVLCIVKLTAWTVLSSLMKKSQGRPGGSSGGRSPWQVILAPSAQYGAHMYAVHAPNLASNVGAGVTLMGKLTFNVLNSVVVRNQDVVDKYIMQREPGLGLVSVSNHIRWGKLLLSLQS